jgi:hypothetical protein
MISYHFHNKFALILRFVVLSRGKMGSTVSIKIRITAGSEIWPYNNTNINIFILNHSYYKHKYSGFLKIPRTVNKHSQGAEQNIYLRYDQHY